MYGDTLETVMGQIRLQQATAASAINGKRWDAPLSPRRRAEYILVTTMDWTDRTNTVSTVYSQSAGQPFKGDRGMSEDKQ